LESAKKRALEAEEILMQRQKESEERLQRAQEAEAKMEQMQEALQRMEEKLGNMESENQVLRQQTLVLSPTKGLLTALKALCFR
jgi:myosin-5